MSHKRLRQRPGNRPGTYLPFYLSKWQESVVDDQHRLTRTFKFEDRAQARVFAGQVLQMASDIQRFPNMYIYGQHVCVIWRSSTCDGWEPRDIAAAGRTDTLYERCCKQWQASA